LPKKERDRYNNLILLCPTHHTDIDKNSDDWPVDKLHIVKKDHENWVSEQLSAGNISVSKIDNTEFLQRRFDDWIELSRDHVAIVLSLTPLRVSGDQIDTMEEATIKALEKATIPGKPIQQVSPNHTRPSEFGIVNEMFYDLPDRFGHSDHIFKNGHCEFFHELGQDVNTLTSEMKEAIHDIRGANRAIRYVEITEAVDSGLTWVETLWKDILPYEYLLFQCQILNTKNTTLFSCKPPFSGPLFGHPTRSQHLKYEDILQKDHDQELLAEQVLKWFSSCYGLVLPRKIDDNGKYMSPERM
jgi:hypothetical protein